MTDAKHSPTTVSHGCNEHRDVNSAIHWGCPDCLYALKQEQTRDRETIRLLAAALEECVEALRLTREYVGEDVLPAIEGWSWYDATERGRAALARVQEVQG